MKRILLIEDSIDCFNLIRNILANEFEIIWARNIHEAKDNLNLSFDAIILDLILPDGEGTNLLKILKGSEKHLHTPVIILTSKQELPDKIFGFSLGASDYVCKPFEPIELKFRLMARIKENSEILPEIHFQDISLHLINNEVYLRKDDKRIKIDLTNNEFKILHHLLTEPGKIFSREDILNSVWGESIFLYPRIIDTYISRLRKKLCDSNVNIKSKNRRGYLVDCTQLQIV